MTDDNEDFKSGFEAGKDFKKKSLRAAGYAAGAAYSVAPEKRTVKKAAKIVGCLIVLAIVGAVGYAVLEAYNKGVGRFNEALRLQNKCRVHNPDYVRIAGKPYAELSSLTEQQIWDNCWRVRDLRLYAPEFSEAILEGRLASYFANLKAETYRNARIDARIAADKEGTFEDKLERAWKAE